VSRQVRTRAMPVRTSQWIRGAESIPALADTSQSLCNWSSIPSTPVEAPRMAGCGERCEPLERAVHPLSALAAGSMAGNRLWFLRRVAASASLYRRPSDRHFHRVPILPYFPCSPSVTRFGAYPAPCGTARLCFAWARTTARQCTERFWPMRPAGFGFQKIFVQRTQKDFPNLPKKTPLVLGSGAHSRRFAQECPEGNPGKYKQGELTWHSTKTRSL
jgi:hypothetical protein